MPESWSPLRRRRGPGAMAASSRWAIALSGLVVVTLIAGLPAGAAPDAGEPPTDEPQEGAGGGAGGRGSDGGDCGLRVGIVLDSSPSIVDAGGEDQVRGAATGLVDALGGTGAEVRISAFSGSPVSLTSGWVSLLEPGGRRVARQAVATMGFGGDGTNWEAALADLEGQQADIVVLVTDGLPNEYGAGLTSPPSPQGTGEFDPVALAAGVSAADGLRAGGARVVAVGAGAVRADSLAQVAGPTEGDDYHLGDLTGLGASLTEVATDLCGTTLTVAHRVDGIPTGDAEYTLRTGGAPRTATTGTDGFAHLGLEDGAGVVTLQGPAELPLSGVRCERGGTEVDTEVDEAVASVTVDVEGRPVTCTFDWMALIGADVVADVARVPGTARILSFEPPPGGGFDVVGCLGMGDDADACEAVRFGVSFSAGFAVIRYDDSCAGCPDVDTLAVTEVTADGPGVRFRLDAGRGVGLSDHLDLTVRPRLLADIDLAGSVHRNDMLLVDVLGAQVVPCLAHIPAGGSVRGGNRRIDEGVGC